MRIWPDSLLIPTVWVQTEMWALTTKTMPRNKKKLSLEEIDLTMDILMRGHTCMAEIIIPFHGWDIFYFIMKATLEYYICPHSASGSKCAVPLCRPPSCAGTHNGNVTLGMADLTLTSDFLAFSEKKKQPTLLHMTGPSHYKAIVLFHSLSYTARTAQIK